VSQLGLTGAGNVLTAVCNMLTGAGQLFKQVSRRNLLAFS
jgi:hypothetical protein